MEKIHSEKVPCGVDWKSAYQLKTSKIASEITCKTCIKKIQETIKTLKK